jgi:hypothetical protein
VESQGMMQYMDMMAEITFKETSALIVGEGTTYFLEEKEPTILERFRNGEL